MIQTVILEHDEEKRKIIEEYFKKYEWKHNIRFAYEANADGAAKCDLAITLGDGSGEKARHMARYSLDVADSACKPDRNYGIVTYEIFEQKLDGWFKSVYRDDNAIMEIDENDDIYLIYEEDKDYDNLNT